MVMQAAQSKQVAGGPQSGNLTQGHSGHVRMMTEWFPLVDVRQMHLNGGQAHCRKSVPNRDAGMGVSGRIDDNSLIASSTLLDPVDEFPFAIGLSNVDFYSQILGELYQGRVNAVQGLVAIDGLLPGAEQVQVGSM